MIKYCSHPGCRTLIESGKYCDEHSKRSNKQRFLSKNQRFYKSQSWKDLAAYVRERDKNTCQCCGRLVFGRQAQVDHIEPIWLSPEKRLDSDNCRLLCSRCHPKLEYQPQNAVEKLQKLSFNPDKYF